MDKTLTTEMHIYASSVYNRLIDTAKNRICEHNRFINAKLYKCTNVVGEDIVGYQCKQCTDEYKLYNKYLEDMHGLMIRLYGTGYHRCDPIMVEFEANMYRYRDALFITHARVS